MKKIFFVTAFAMTALVSASSITENKKTLQLLPTPKDVDKYVIEDQKISNLTLQNNDPGDDEIIITPPKKRQP
ncbi:hypothetical protein [Flavobacterium faecale]|uniref:hypothetical protein n=1 Tax=Flavobacterium faecale TaxID=1355330 RepID=UPI003AAA67F6